MYFICLISLLILFKSCACIECYDIYSCLNQNITETGAAAVECYGLFSCAFEFTTITSTSNGDIRCDGAYSCFNTSQIIHNDPFESNAGIYCNGLLSCANVQFIYNNYGYISCQGQQSCYNSILNVTNSRNVYCDSERACYKSTIISGGYNYVYGYLGAQTIGPCAINILLLLLKIIIHFYSIRLVSEPSPPIS